jgi:putative ATP-binding cassette transporter
MEPGKLPALRVTVARLAKAVGVLANSADGGKAKGLFAGLITLLLAANGLTVVNSYVGRNFMTAIASRNEMEFVRQAVFYVGVFAASTLVAVAARFAEQRLGLLWRASLTGRMLRLYLADGAYLRLATSGEIDNPDQRIAEDVRGFAASTLSFALMAFNSTITIVAFAGVMLSISPLLSAVAILYAALGSGATLWFGRPLIQLNYKQLDKEASFRSALTHLRENAEAISLAREEDAQSTRLLRQLEELIANARAITKVNRNVGFFTTGYNWMIQIIPALIMAPAYFAGQVEFGVVTQSAGAFATSVAAFSLIVTQFESLSSLAAVMSRLNSLADAVEGVQSAFPLKPPHGQPLLAVQAH